MDGGLKKLSPRLFKVSSRLTPYPVAELAAGFSGVAHRLRGLD